MTPAPLRLVAAPADIALPPHNADAEQSCVGSLLYGNIRLGAIRDIVDSPEAFYVLQHRDTFQAVSDVEESGGTPDTVTVATAMKARGTFDRAGGMQALIETLNAVPVVNEHRAREYAAEVRRCWLLRQIIAQSQALTAEAHQPGADPGALGDQHAEGLQTIARSAGRDAGIVRTSTAIATALRNALSGRVEGVRTGFRGLDDLLGPLQPKRVYVVGARTSVGKSALALQCAYQIQNERTAVLYVSLEMDATQFAVRILSTNARVASHRIQSHALNQTEIAALLAAGDRIKESRVYYGDTQVQTMATIRATSEKLARKLAQEGVSLGLIVIDHIGLVRPSNVNAKRSREQEVAETSRAMRLLAEERCCAVMGLAQINRDAEKRDGSARMPKLHDLRESGSIEQDADAVLLLHRPRDASGQFIASEGATLTVAKNRSGPLGIVTFDVDAERLAFVERF